MTTFFNAVFYGLVLLTVLEFVLWMYRRNFKLEPDICQCGHGRSYHVRGRGDCREIRVLDDGPNGPKVVDCPCQIFVLDPILTDSDRDAAKEAQEEEVKA